MAISGTVFRDYSEGVRIDEETSFAAGGVEADAISFGQVTNLTSTWTDNTMRLLGIGEGRNESKYVYGPVDISGSVEWNVLADNIGTAGGSTSFLQFAIGSIQGSGSTASPWEIVEEDNIDYTNMYSFAMWAQNESGTDDVDKFEGCIINSFTLTAVVGELLKASADWTAQKVTCASSISTAFVTPTANPWSFQQGDFKWGSGPTSVAGVQNFSVTMGNSPLIFRSIGSRLIEKPEYGKRLYDFTITCKMTSVIATTLRDDLFGQANSFIAGIDPSTRTADLEIALVFAEGAASGDKTMTVALDQCVISSISKPIAAGQGLVEVTMTGFAKQGKPDSTDNVPIRFHQIT